jgi:hypothetical protein
MQPLTSTNGFPAIMGLCSRMPRNATRSQGFRNIRVRPGRRWIPASHIPRGTGWRGGERWNAEIAWEFLRAHSSWDERQLRSELRRCLGLPGQAPSYQLGERIWLQAREDAMARTGRDFNLKDFHAKALSLGAMGLDPLREALARV